VLLGVCSFFVIIITAGSLTASTDRSELDAELERLHEDLNEYIEEMEAKEEEERQYRAELAQIEQQEQSLLDLIEQYDVWVESSRQRVEYHEQLKEEALANLRGTSRELNEMQRKLEKQEKLLGRRLREMYKQGEMARSRVWVGAESFADLVVNNRYYREILEHDQQVLEEYRSQRLEMEQLRAERSERLQERRRIREEIATLYEEQKQALRHSEQAREELRQRQEFYQEQLDQLQARQQELTTVVSDLRREKDHTEARLQALQHEFARQEGELSWPVENYTIEQPFGRWEEDGLTQDNQGIDLRVHDNPEVYSVYTGEVRFAREFSGMGKVVVISHGGDFNTTYAQLAEVTVEEGDHVNVGDQVGLAGDSGADHRLLYFQVIEGREVHDPEDWLK